MAGINSLSGEYERLFAEMLHASAAVAGDMELTPFWPKIGARYSGDLLVVGRATNGWIDRWFPGDGQSPAEMARIARATGEGTVNGDQLGWVLDRWRPRDGGYSTATSQFWQTTRLVMGSLRPGEQDWPSRIAWTNLAKLAPWAGGNPGTKLRTIQQSHGARLLEMEVEELAPRTVVAFTGRSWFEPFATRLGLPIEWTSGYVEGFARTPECIWVVAVHPMTRSPRAVADAVLSALG
jgi:hypothetical protein